MNTPSTPPIYKGTDLDLETTQTSQVSPEVSSDPIPVVSSPSSSLQTAEIEDLGQVKRTKFPPVWLKDYVAHTIQCPEEPHHVSPDLDSAFSSLVQGNTLYPLISYISDDMFSPQHDFSSSRA